MDKIKIRQQFQKYRQVISDLQEGHEESYFYHSEALSRAERRAEACRREEADRTRQEECDRWYREDELRGAISNLERAQSYGDEWGIAEATRKLKKLNY